MKKLVNVQLLTKELRRIYDSFSMDTESEIDVRLQVYAPGEWAVRFGLSDYDQDHRGYWGAATINLKEKFSYEHTRQIARDLISQAEEHFAQNI